MNYGVPSSRRDFMRNSTLGAAGAVSLGWGARLLADPLRADLLIVNARVHTVDPRLPTAEAFVVGGDRFLGVGSNEDMRALAGRSTRVFDAKGMTIVPGFIDCHNHAVGETLLYEVLVGNPYDVEFVTIESIVAKLKVRAATTPPGQWVKGYFFDDTKVKDGRVLTARDLDGVSTQHPVMVHHRGGHTRYVNNKVFELSGITADTPNPFGGTFDRSPDGRLNGRVTDRAINAINKAGRVESFTPAQQLQRSRTGLAYISKQFVRSGLTSVHHEGGDLSAMQQIRAAGELRHRISYEGIGSDTAEFAGMHAALDDFTASGIRSGFGDEWIRIGASFEHLEDGSFSERTMAMSEPYPGSNPPYRGNITRTQADLNAWTEKIHRAGIQVNCHANGDVAVDMVLTAFERMLKLLPVPDARPKITHCTVINDELIRRMKAINAVPAVFSTYPFYNSDKFAFYGERIMRRAIAVRSMLDAGIRVAAGSDFQPGPFSPLMAIQAMVTRRGWDGKVWGANQRVTVDEALRVNTLNGAYNSHEETIKGSITPGKLADYVVLADDPHTVQPDRIKDIKVVSTVTGGRVQYES